MKKMSRRELLRSLTQPQTHRSILKRLMPRVVGQLLGDPVPRPAVSQDVEQTALEFFGHVAPSRKSRQ